MRQLVFATEWQQVSYQQLMAELAKVKQTLLDFIELPTGKALTSLPRQETSPVSESSSALDSLVTGFNLSPFERQLLLLCAGMELDPEFATLCAKAQGNANKAYPTLHLALLLFAGHWSALAPHASLRYWHLLEVTDAGCLS